jgi:PAS domain S-box-containing protein
VSHDHSAALARRWGDAIAGIGFVPLPAATIAEQVAAWTAHLLALLATEPFQPDGARPIGAALARLHALHPDVLERSLTLLGDHLLAELPPAEALAAYPHLTALLGVLAAGFAEQAGATILAEQERVRAALLAERDALAGALRRSEARFRAVFERSALGIALLAPDGHILAANPALQAMLGYAEAALRRLAPTDITHPDDVPETARCYAELLAGRRDRYQLDKRYLHRGGRVVWARLSVSLVRDVAGAPLFGVALVEDVTARRRAEAERTSARRRLNVAREAERGHLARELHDGPLQDLEGALFHLLTCVEPAGETAERAAPTAVAATLRTAIQALRATCGELRPPVLVHYGLGQAIRAHLAAPELLPPGLAVRLALPPDEDTLPEPVRLALYRIYQQAVQNVVQHAQAHTVTIRLHLGAERVVLEVEDDGRGFVVAEQGSRAARAGHLGLVGAAERAELLGGRLTLRSVPGAGTLLRVTAPRQTVAEAGLPAVAGATGSSLAGRCDRKEDVWR